MLELPAQSEARRADDERRAVRITVYGRVTSVLGYPRGHSNAVWCGDVLTAEVNNSVTSSSLRVEPTATGFPTGESGKCGGIANSKPPDAGLGVREERSQLPIGVLGTLSREVERVAGERS